MAKINISIPQPCHENWDAMTPESKGRFCDSCQKKVFDFTIASDREIVVAFQQDKNLCGRFLDTQLNRDLVKPEKKNPIWLATSAALISLVGLNEVHSQEKNPTEQTEPRVLLGKPAPPKDKPNPTTKGEIVANPEIEITGIVSDKTEPLPGANVVIKGTSTGVQTDFDGKFSIKAKIGDRIVVSFVGFKDFEFEITTIRPYNSIMLEESAEDLKGVVPTFLGYVKVNKTQNKQEIPNTETKK